MNKADIICKLRANNYSFEDEGDQVVVQLARKYFLKLYIENDAVVKSEDIVKQFGWLNERRLKTYTKISMIAYLIFILLLVLECIFNPYFFPNGGKYFFIMFTSAALFQLLEFWYYNKRLSKIKKLLNLND